jgi:dephospho-CoA kinase
MAIKVALTGRMRSGKDSAAAYLIEKHGFVRFAFADGLKRICRELFPDQFADGSKPRTLLQGVGVAMREFDPDVWVNATMREIARYQYDTERTLWHRPNYVITDLRFPNEYARLRAEGFVIIRVNASDETRIQRMIDAGDAFTAADLEHETERHIDSFAVDYEIDNNGSLAELYAQVDAVMSDILRKEAE